MYAWRYLILGVPSAGLLGPVGLAWALGRLDWATYTRLRSKDLSLFEALRPSEPLSDGEAEALANRPETGYRAVSF